MGGRINNMYVKMLQWCWWCNLADTLLQTFGFIILRDMTKTLRSATMIHESLTKNLREHQGTIVFRGPWFTGLNFVITSDHDNVNYILNKNFTNYGKGDGFKEIFEYLGNGIFNADGESWRLQKKLIHSLFKDARFALARDSITRRKISQGLFLILDEAAESGFEVDVQDLFRRFMFDTSCMLLLDHDPKCLSIDLPDVACEKAFGLIEKIIFRRHVVPRALWKLFRRLDIGEEKKAKRAAAAFDNFLYNCILRMKDGANRKNGGTEGIDLVSFFMIDREEDQEDEEARVLKTSDKFLRDTVFNLMAAGRDAVSAGITWFLWLVVTHPAVEAKIMQEMRRMCKNKKSREKKIFKEGELDDMMYLNASVLETLRLYPPIPFEHKCSREADVLPSGHKIPTNGRIIYSLYAMGRMETIWGDDCFEFKPERWITHDGKIRHVPFYKFIAFNAGQRTCMGKQLALFQIKTVVSALLWNYRFQVLNEGPVSLSSSIVLDMKHGLKMKVFKR